MLSRAIAVPVYLRRLGWLEYNPEFDAYFNGASKILLYSSGLVGAALILFFVFRGYLQRRRIAASLQVSGGEA